MKIQYKMEKLEEFFKNRVSFTSNLNQPSPIQYLFLSRKWGKYA